MSFDLFVSPLPPWTWGEPERRKIIDILYRGTDADDRFYSVRYAKMDGAWEISGLDDWDERPATSRGLCFRRFGGATFTERLYELADQVDAMVYWPGDPPFMAVTRPELLARVPAELSEGDAVVVANADALMKQIVK